VNQVCNFHNSAVTGPLRRYDLSTPVAGLLQWSLAKVREAAGAAFGASVGASLTAVVFVWLALRRPGRPLSLWNTA
jgi:hypothetical protein